MPCVNLAADEYAFLSHPVVYFWVPDLVAKGNSHIRGEGLKWGGAIMSSFGPAGSILCI